MSRVIAPLAKMGADVYGRGGVYAPMAVRGQKLHGIEYELPVPSAQVKSALLLAGALAHRGQTLVHEPLATRDHTENMFGAFGVELTRQLRPDGGHTLAIQSGQKFACTTVKVPGDFSSAAFLLAAAAVVPESELIVTGVGINATRTGLLTALRDMGADLDTSNVRLESGEKVADVSIRHRPLRGIALAKNLVPLMIDELPVFAVIAAMAKGTTLVEGAGELRVKETDRISAIVTGLQRLGVDIEERSDGFVIQGGRSFTGGEVESFGDHRIAMSLAVAGVAASHAVTIHGWEAVDISFPGFADALKLAVQPKE